VHANIRPAPHKTIWRSLPDAISAVTQLNTEEQHVERTPPQGGEQQPTLEAVPPHQETGDERVIREGIERALQGGTEIDDRTARSIASQLHEGQASALYSLASSGTIAEEVHAELTRDFDQQPEQVRNWINWLGTYCLNREWKGPVTGWVENAEAQDRADLMERISAGSVRTLGEIASVIGGSVGSEPDREADADEEDIGNYFSWADAATWSPNQDRQADELARSRLDELFGEVQDEELGSVEDIGWFGLLRHEGRPGGIVLSQNSYGFRNSWETGSDEELDQRWEELRREWDAFTEATRAHAREAGDRDDNTERPETWSGHHPEIWVGSLSDYNAGHLHGVWLDATLDADELHAAVQFMLRNGYDRHAEEWAIMDHSDFCGADISEYESLETVSRIAKGVAEHGEAFAKWCGYLGTTDMDEVERTFSDAFRGKYENTEAYVEQILEETEAYRYLDDIPDEELRRYAKYDTEQMATDYEIELYVVEAENGGVLVFDPRV
jgi:antirestriction protein